MRDRDACEVDWVIDGIGLMFNIFDNSHKNIESTFPFISPNILCFPNKKKTIYNIKFPLEHFHYYVWNFLPEWFIFLAPGCKKYQIF